MGTGVLIYLQFLRGLLLPMPGVTEKLCYGTPAFYVNNKLFTRIREDGETLMVHSTERDKWIAANPKVYFVTDHHLNYPSLLVQISEADPAELENLLIQAWRNRATKKLIAEWGK